MLRNVNLRLYKSTDRLQQAHYCYAEYTCIICMRLTKVERKKASTGHIAKGKRVIRIFSIRKIDIIHKSFIFINK